MAERDYTAAQEVMLDKIYPLVESMGKAAKLFAVHQRELLAAASREARTRVSSSRVMACIPIALCLLAGGVAQWSVRGVNRVLRQFAAEMAARSGKGASESRLTGETSAATERLHSTTRSNAGYCQSASAVTEQVNQQVYEANQSLGQDSVRAIDVSSGKISKIIKVIDEIAFQTKILALNAAVEAARAGEAAMGFAVWPLRSATPATVRLAAKDMSLGAPPTIGESGPNGFGSPGRSGSGAREICSNALGTQTTAANAEESTAAATELSAQSESLQGVAERLSALV